MRLVTTPTPDTAPGNDAGCRHEVAFRGGVGVVACGSCWRLDFFGPGGTLDPTEAVASLFGSYDLVGPVDAVGAPAPRVLAYRPDRRGKSGLQLLPTGCWLAAGPSLSMATDGSVLLLATQPGPTTTGPVSRNWVS